MCGTLYLVATPIGNLSDISPRAAEILAAVDFIAAEDTRVSVKLLNHLGIKKPLVSYYAHNRTESGEKILIRIQNGENCALVTDAGMPAISDPGEDLVRICGESGIPVIAIPGPCAAICALALSGLPTGRFTFEGFLSTAKKSRFEHLDALKNERRTMIFYEAPHKLCATLRDMAQYFGPERRISISRELTKLHEETMRLTLGDAICHFDTVAPRGEFVLIIEGAQEPAAPSVTLADALEKVQQYRSAGLSLREATKRCAVETGFAKNVLYDAAIKEKE
jgi:16S rRNA (cytidine1402-2'-O)-methyltransferase